MPGGTYTTTETSASFAVTVDGTYDGNWTATTSGQFQPVIRRYDGTLAAVLTTAPVAVTQGAVVTTSFAHPIGDTATIQIDDDGDGAIDRTVVLGLTAQGDGASDTTAPTSQVSIRRFVDGGEQLVEVTIAATDSGGSGIAAVDVGLDAGT